MADSTWTIPIDGSKKAIGPFPFTVRKVTIQNRCTAGNVWAVDDKGAQYEATPLTAVESKANDTVYLTVFIDAAQLLGSAAIIVSSEEPVLDISTSQLSTQAQAGSGSNVVIPTIALAAFPPAAPVDGQIVSLVLPSSYDPVGGKVIRWLCTYDAATAMWDVSGPDLEAELDTSEASAGNTYVDLATVGPSISLPRPGDYDVWVGADATSSAGQTPCFMSYAVGGNAAQDSDSAIESYGPTGFHSVQKGARRKPNLAASTTLTAKYKGTGSATSTWQKRRLSVRAVRIT